MLQTGYRIFRNLAARCGRAGLILGVSLLATAVRADLHDTTMREYPGRIEALNKAEVSNAIASIVSGIYFKPGQVVRAGDRLITLDPTDFELAVETERANVLRAQATLKSAQQDYERMAKLRTRGSASNVQLLKAEVALALGKAALARSKADLRAAEVALSRTVIRAPISGVISPATVSIGAYVKTGRDPLASIVQLDPVRLAYDVPFARRVDQLDLEALRFPDSLLQRITLSVIISEGWRYPQTTRPDNVSGKVDAESGTLTVWAELANPNGLLRPGMRVRVQSRFETE